MRGTAIAIPLCAMGWLIDKQFPSLDLTQISVAVGIIFFAIERWTLSEQSRQSQIEGLKAEVEKLTYDYAQHKENYVHTDLHSDFRNLQQDTFQLKAQVAYLSSSQEFDRRLDRLEMLAKVYEERVKRQSQPIEQ